MTRDASRRSRRRAIRATRVSTASFISSISSKKKTDFAIVDYVGHLLMTFFYIFLQAKQPPAPGLRIFLFFVALFFLRRRFLFLPAPSLRAPLRRLLLRRLQFLRREVPLVLARGAFGGKTRLQRRDGSSRLGERGVRLRGALLARLRARAHRRARPLGTRCHLGEPRVLLPEAQVILRENLDSARRFRRGGGSFVDGRASARAFVGSRRGSRSRSRSRVQKPPEQRPTRPSGWRPARKKRV